MALINYLIAAIFIVITIRDFKKGLFLTVSWCLSLQILKVTSNVDAFSLVSIFIISMFVIKLNKRLVGKRYPFIFPTLFCLSSICLTNLLTVPHWPSSLLNFATSFVMVGVFWYSIQSIEDVKKFSRYFFLFLIALIAYGLFEELTKWNPIMDFIVNNHLNTGSADNPYDYRYGFKRIQSFLGLFGALGVCCVISIIYYVNLSINYLPVVAKYKKQIPYLIGGLFLCVLFTGTRSIYVCFAVGMTFLLQRKIIHSKQMFLMIVLAILLIPFVGIYFDSILRSFVDTNSVSGSDVDLRQDQLDISLYFMSKSPWVGNGFGFTFDTVKYLYIEQIAGAESVWFPLMIDQGLLGVLSYATVILASLYYCWAKRNWAGLCICLAFLVGKSMSSIPGMQNTWFLYFVILTSKLRTFRSY